ncbi:MAG: cation transporter [Anaerolineae bacterium]|nr:cation transporter [Anaerolineae bacterium]
MNSLPDNQVCRRERTLLAAVLLSAWAPLATGVAVITSRSTTQLADFVRRTVELIALFISWRVFRYLARGRELDAHTRARVERVAGLSVAAALGCSAVVMSALALSRGLSYRPGGNVYPGLAIAGMGLVTNLWFWRRYVGLAREQYSSVIEAQCHLYRAKALVDLCVITALAAVALAPSHGATGYVDLLGSLAVAAYLLWSALRAARTAMAAGDSVPGPARARARPVDEYAEV